MKLIEKIFGSYSKKELKKIEPIVDKIEEIEKTLASLSDDELREKTNEFKQRLQKGETLEDILPESYLHLFSFQLFFLDAILFHQLTEL